MGLEDLGGPVKAGPAGEECLHHPQEPLSHGDDEEMEA